MISLKLISRSDGWAIVEKENDLFLIRPSFADGILPLNHHDINGFLVAGFEIADEMIFENVALIISYLNNLVKEVRNFSDSQPLGSTVSKLLRHAPESVVESFIKKARTDLFERGLYEPANRAVATLSSLPVVEGNPTLSLLVLKLFRDLKEQESDRYNFVSGSIDLSATYPLITHKMGIEQTREFIAEIQYNRSLFNFARAA